MRRLQLENPKLKAQNVGLERIKAVAKADSKQRYDLILESVEGKKLKTFGEDAAPAPPATQASESQVIEVGASSPAESKAEPADTESGIWWIKARQGHSIKV